MKRIIILGLALVAAMGIANAQTDDDLFQARLQFHQRNASQKHLNGLHPQSTKEAPATKDANGVPMPANAWFPGEWEEVKAIVTTVY